jgi:hypothetical protein
VATKTGDNGPESFQRGWLLGRSVTCDREGPQQFYMVINAESKFSFRLRLVLPVYSQMGKIMGRDRGTKFNEVATVLPNPWTRWIGFRNEWLGIAPRDLGGYEFWPNNCESSERD